MTGPSSKERRRYLIIFNPHANGSRALRAEQCVRRLFQDAGVTWELIHTRRSGHATALAARAAADGWHAIVVAGGDGTINEVVNGLFHQESAGVLPIGIIPIGSGNDFVKSLSLPIGDVEAAVRRIIDGRPQPVDVGRVNSHYFVNGVGWGLDGAVALETRRAPRLHGFARYLWAVLKVIRRYRTAHVRIEIDGRPIDEDAIMIAITNGPCHGGGFWICPHAQSTDGRLDVCVARPMRPLQLIPLIYSTTRGTHVGHPKIWFETGRVIELQGDISLPAHADGEILGTALSRLRVEVIPGGLQVLV